MEYINFLGKLLLALYPSANKLLSQHAQGYFLSLDH